MENLFTTAVAFHIGSLTVRWYGILISSAMLIGILLAYKETQRQHLNPDFLINSILLLIPAAIIGARCYYVLFRWSEWYSSHPEDIFTVWKGGLAIHGGIIAGALAILIYCRAKKEDFLRWADILAPSLVFGQAIGRWGNFANQEAYGSVIPEGSFWSWVPLQIYADGAYHHPTFLYESAWDMAVFVTLLILLRRRHRVGSIFAAYLIFYSIGRFFIEQLRTDSLMIGPFRTAVLVSVLCVAAGALILWLIRRRPALDVAAPPLKKTPRQATRKR